ncbi:helix-turn-helix domain-containing protein [Mangrovibacterium diazotrophicum]|uniref:Excisionase family DNA binding protein n=1 Tax=Mangrovibacterium diazotrophicum TaxID=1261403 RepID=A0A419W3K8_9BACT|nr:helix-turn-helix domain-containing protein [Mangrovibacterium diazotrophicum]RKD90058.1 excisionase family DNA binding protein [Mangrovibacterium diazotrophicum]
MTSKIQVQRICQHCGKEFTARTTVTKCCSDHCSKMFYKARQRAEKIKQSNTETQQIINRPIEELKAKDFLSVKEVSDLLGCSVRTVYRLVETGQIKATNLGERLTRIKRTDIDSLLT